MVCRSAVSWTHCSSQRAKSNLGEQEGETSATDAIHKLNVLKMLLLACIPSSLFNPSGNAMTSALGSVLPVYSSKVNAVSSLQPSVLDEKDHVRGVPVIDMAAEWTLQDLEQIAAWKPPTEPKAKTSDLKSLTVQELKDKLKAVGLKVSGNKAQLIARLEEHAKVSEMPQQGAEPEQTSEEMPDLKVEDQLADTQTDSRTSHDPEREYEGTVLSFNDIRHWGFIDCKELHGQGYESDKGLFFHRKDVVGGLSLWAGDPVRFMIGSTDSGKLEALSVTMIPASEATQGAAQFQTDVETPDEIAALRAELAGLSVEAVKMQEDDLQSLKVGDLKDKLKALGLKTSGKKAELIERLEQHAAEMQASQAASAASGLAKASASQNQREVKQFFDDHPIDFKPEDLDDSQLHTIAAQMLHFYKCQLAPSTTHADLSGPAFDVMAMILAKHPSAATKLGTGIRRIFVAVPQAHPTPCFHIETMDGVVDDISYRKCLGLPRPGRR